MRIVLHIGTDKTGSTAIQVCLAANRDWLRTKSVFLPETGFTTSTGHENLLSALRPADLLCLRRELVEAKSRHFELALLSWEGMCTYSPRQISTLLGALDGFSIEVIAYIRDQAEVLQSGHLQGIRNDARMWLPPGADEIASLSGRLRASAARALRPGTVRGLIEPSDFSDRLRKALFLRNPARNYLRMLRKWERSLGMEAIKVRVYERDRLIGNDIISDFLSALGCSLDDQFTPMDKPGNPSLDVESAVLLEDWRRNPSADVDLPTASSLVQSIINSEGPASRYFLDRKDVAAIRRHYRRSNERLAARYLGLEQAVFSNNQPCELGASLREIDDRVQSLSKSVLLLDKEAGTLWGTASGKHLHRMITADESWDSTENEALHCTRPTASISFRIPIQMLSGAIATVRVQLAGNYAAEGIKTNVNINGLDLGLVDLGNVQPGPGLPALELPVVRLMPNERVVIRLDHKVNGPDLPHAQHIYTLWGVRFELEPRG